MKTLRERFKEKYLKKPSGCWEWQACKHGRGYGYFYTNPEFSDRKMDYAHRVSMFLHSGEKVPEELSVLHSCDNPSCVNPAHLRVGTHKDNMQDMVKKGRCRPPTQRYTQEDMFKAVLMRDKGILVKDIASYFGMDRGHASRMSRGLVPTFKENRGGII